MVRQQYSSKGANAHPGRNPGRSRPPPPPRAKAARPASGFPIVSGKDLRRRAGDLLRAARCAVAPLPAAVVPQWVSVLQDHQIELELRNDELRRVHVELAAARKREESALRRSERELSNFFNGAPLGLQWLSASGRILRANQAQLSLMGCSPAEYVGHQIEAFHADPALAVGLLKRLVAREAVTNFRMQIRRPEGSLRDVLVDANSLWEGNQFLHASVFTRDISRQVEFEREIIASR